MATVNAHAYCENLATCVGWDREKADKFRRLLESRNLLKHAVDLEVIDRAMREVREPNGDQATPNTS